MYVCKYVCMYVCMYACMYVMGNIMEVYNGENTHAIANISIHIKRIKTYQSMQ